MAMNAMERVKMVKAMEYITRQLNDENIFYSWLAVGVGDGDIEYGDLEATPESAEELDYYIEDATFADLMHTFLTLMSRAKRSGGLYCDGIIDKEAE